MEINENIEVIHDDCLNVLSHIPDNSFYMVLADPPYYKITKNGWDNQWKSENEYLDWCKQWISESIRILKDGGSFYIWGGVGEKGIMGYMFLKGIYL